MKMSEIPVNQFTASELVRLCLRKRDQNDVASVAHSEDSDEVEDDLDLVFTLLLSVGVGVKKQMFFLEKQFFLISCFLRVLCNFFPTFLENKFSRGGGGGVCGVSF